MITRIRKLDKPRLHSIITEDAMWEATREAARRLGITISEYIRRAIRESLKQEAGQ